MFCKLIKRYKRETPPGNLGYYFANMALGLRKLISYRWGCMPSQGDRPALTSYKLALGMGPAVHSVSSPHPLTPTP